MPEHVRMWPGDPYARLLGEPPEPAGGGVPVHACAAGVEQDRAGDPGIDCAVDGASGRWWQRDQDELAALAAHLQDPVAVFFAEVARSKAPWPAGGLDVAQQDNGSMEAAWFEVGRYSDVPADAGGGAAGGELD